MILFCLPYAGGSELIYRKWSDELRGNIKVYPIKLKGRGRRFGEGFYKNIDEAVEDIFLNIKDNIKNEEYAIFGHSMGSILAFELYYKILSENLKMPKHIFFSAHKAPNMMKRKEHFFNLPDNEFIKKLISLGGTPRELLSNSELLKIFLPIIRNDFKILEKYRYKSYEKKIECDVSIFNGEDDDITEFELLAWRNLTSASCAFYNFKGDHFFINKDTKNILRIIDDILIKEMAI